MLLYSMNTIDVQLKSDMNEKYFCNYDESDATDLKIYIEMFSKKYNLKPEHESESIVQCTYIYTTCFFEIFSWILDHFYCDLQKN